MPRTAAGAQGSRPDDEAGGSTSPAVGPPLSADERRALLDREIKARTREARASLERKGEFDAVLVRGQQVNHLLHFVILIVILAGLPGVGRFVMPMSTALILALVLGSAYGCYWLLLALTSGLERERIEVDEHGVLTSVVSGRRVDSRENALKLIIPGAILVIGLYLAASLARDIVAPPPPNCSIAWLHDDDPCLKAPSFNLGAGAEPSAIGPPGQTDTSGGYFSVATTRVMERVIRSFQLVLALVAVLASAWFLRRMLNGKGVLWLGPVRKPRE
jgi:hypothetical protein